MRHRGVEVSPEPILDEEEQERIIDALQHENRSSSKSFRRAISILALLSSLIVACMVSSRNVMLCLLSITSLVMTAFTLHYLPDEALDDLDGPLARFLPFLNGILALTVMIITWLKNTPTGTPKRLDLHCLPVIHFGLATLVRWSARHTARSIQELEKKRYKLKGA